MRWPIVLVSAALVGACASIAGLDGIDEGTSATATSSSSGEPGSPSSTGGPASSTSTSSSGSSSTSSTAGGTAPPLDSGTDAPPAPPTEPGPPGADCKTSTDCTESGKTTCNEDFHCHALCTAADTNKECRLNFLAPEEQQDCCADAVCVVSFPKPRCVKCVGDGKKPPTDLGGDPIRSRCCSRELDGDKCKPAD